MHSTLLVVLLVETGYELRKAWRAPEFILPTLALPVSFYLLFGIMLSSGAGHASLLLATYGVFAVMGPAIFGFGAGVASEREKGWLEIKRAAPAPASCYIGAKLLTTVIFACFALVPVYAAAGYLGDVRLSRSAWFGLLLTHLLAVAPFSLLGLTLGFRFSANGAIALSNFTFIVMAVLGGLWFPIQYFPAIMQSFAQWLPSFHLAELSLTVVDARPSESIASHLTAVAAMTAVFAAAAGLSWLRQHR